MTPMGYAKVCGENELFYTGESREAGIGTSRRNEGKRKPSRKRGEPYPSPIIGVDVYGMQDYGVTGRYLT